MRIVVSVVGVLILLVGVAAHGNELVGTWRFDRATGARASQIPASFSYSFAPDGSCVMSFTDKDGSLSATTWSYETEGNTVRLKLLGSKKLAEVFQYSVAGEILTMQHRDKNQPTLILRRSEPR